MKPDKIYIDNMFLVRWFLHKFYPIKYKKEPAIIKFLSDDEEMEKYISVISIAELVKTLKYDDKFKKFKLKFQFIEDLIIELQNMIGFDVILKENIKGVKIDGVIISKNIKNFAYVHPHLIDCIHVDISKSHELYFITDEKKMGKLKGLYENIMTENKLRKQFK